MYGDDNIPLHFLWRYGRKAMLLYSSEVRCSEVFVTADVIAMSQLRTAMRDRLFILLLFNLFE